MPFYTSANRLRLSLSVNDQIPLSRHWLVEDGYVRWACWNDQYELVSLGVWGPGDLILVQPDWIQSGHELRCLTRAVVEEAKPSAEEIHLSVHRQLRQLSQLTLIGRIRPADQRLMELLVWIGETFGSVNSNGIRLSLVDMNLTHRGLAELSGLTRVTVTKSLNRFKAEGLIRSLGDTDLLVPRPQRSTPLIRVSRLHHSNTEGAAISIPTSQQP